jgi:hypothetical protein
MRVLVAERGVMRCGVLGMQKELVRRALQHAKGAAA